MPYANNFWKALLGNNAQVLVAKATGYTDDANLEDFVANAAEGEVGVFKESDHTAFDGLGAASETELIYIALKRDSQVEKTVPFKIADLAVSKTAYEAPVKQVTDVTISTAPTAGKFYALGFLDTTIGNQPFPKYNYEIKAAAGETADTLGAKFVAAINSTTSVANKDRDLIVTAAYDNGTNVLSLTAKEFGVTFRVTISENMSDIATIAYTTTTKLGSGFPAQVKLLQDAGDIYKGVTTNYPNQGANPEDFGKPTDFVSNSLEYNIFNISGHGTENSKTPHKKAYFDRNIIICVPNAGGADAQLTTILGL